MRTMLLILALFTTGCGQTLATFRLSEDVTMDVTKMTATDSTFEVRVEFNEDTGYDYLIQEGDLEAGLWLVECWKTDSDGDIDGYDRHWASGLQPVPVLRRNFTVYAGRVEGADLTDRQNFGMLPQNIDGSVITNIDPQVFNYENYFALGHKIQGRVRDRAQVFGTWQLIWTPNQIRIETADGYIVWSDGAVLVFQVGN